MRIDPRRAGVRRRLRDVQRTVAVTGGKGGIGKSFVASALALVLAGRGLRTGLVDLDLTGPCAHLFLGFEPAFPSEPFGVEPPVHHGVRCMSIAHFVGDTPAPLRGSALSSALLEMLAITNWGPLDVLVADMPPGIGDATLDALDLLDGAEFLVVTTPARVVLETVRKTLRFLAERPGRVIGLLENMSRDLPNAAEALAGECEVPFLGRIPFDEAVEAALGDADALGATAAVQALDRCAARFLPVPR